MKLRNIIFSIIAAGIFVLPGCESDADFLSEERKDALTTDNAFLTKSQFESLLGANYRTLQSMYNSGDGAANIWQNGYGMDAMHYALAEDVAYNDWTKVNEFEGFNGNWYNINFQMIKYANTVIDAAQKEGVKWNSETEKNEIIAEGRFFRAWSYRNLVNIYGGMPIIETPLTEPKVDFVRNTKEECYTFIKEDLEFAKSNLPLTTETPGKVVRAAADHLLAEIYICLKDYDNAIAAATRVIDGTDGDYQLMTERFGLRADEPGKTVYWDLFRMGNHNYQTGNKEAIWVAQFEYNLPGGTVNYGRPTIERAMWNRYWLFSKAGYSGTAADSTGRGVAFLRGTDHVNYGIWKNTEGDIRNLESSVKRKYYFAADVTVDGVSYAEGDLIPKSFLTAKEDSMWYIYPNFQKFGTDKHKDEKPDNGFVPDFYVMRLAGTYLLRAEAYLGKGQKDKAADDINVIKARAKAPLITASDVTIDYILDERLRELYGEEFRTLTLGRLGLIYDRTKRFGYSLSKSTIKEYNNLFPIPQSVIDRNVGAEFKQNPGY